MRAMTQDRWISAIALADLPESTATRVDLDGTAILLYRTGDRILAVGARCTHQGAPLDRGPVRVSGSEVTITCPVHGSMFRLPDGRVVRPPAARPLPTFETRVEADRVQIRPH